MAGKLLNVHIHAQCIRLTVEVDEFEMVSKICGGEKDRSLENCTKCKLMYKAVDEKKISAGIGCRVGRKVYTGRSMWSCNGDVQKCAVHYEVTKMQMGTEELKLNQSEKLL